MNKPRIRLFHTSKFVFGLLKAGYDMPFFIGRFDLDSASQFAE